MCQSCPRLDLLNTSEFQTSIMLGLPHRMMAKTAELSVVSNTHWSFRAIQRVWWSGTTDHVSPRGIDRRKGMSSIRIFSVWIALHVTRYEFETEKPVVQRGEVNECIPHAYHVCCHAVSIERCCTDCHWESFWSRSNASTSELFRMHPLPVLYQKNTVDGDDM